MIRKSLFGAAGLAPQSAPAKRSVAFSEGSSAVRLSEKEVRPSEVRLSFNSAAGSQADRVEA